MRPLFSFVHKSYIVLLSLVLLAACQPTKPRVLFGHQDDVVYGSDWERLADSTYADTRSCIRDVTGQYPDLIGFDIGGIELCHSRNLDSVPFSRMVEECRRQFERGGKVTLSWHARNPLTGGNSWDATPCLAQIVDSSTAVHDTMQVWIERAAAFVAQVAALQTQPDQLIVRLWHEQSGNWFWWGREAASADDYIALWRWTRTVMDKQLSLRPSDITGSFVHPFTPILRTSSPSMKIRQKVHTARPQSGTRATNTSISSAPTATTTAEPKAQRTISIVPTVSWTQRQDWQKSTANVSLLPRPAVSLSVARIGTPRFYCRSCANIRTSNTSSSGATLGIFLPITFSRNPTPRRRKISNPLSNKSQISNVKFPI